MVRMLRLFSIVVMWISIAGAGIIFLASGAWACNQAGEIFLSGHSAAPWALAIYFGIVFDILGIACIILMVGLGVFAAKNIQECIEDSCIIPSQISDLF